MNGLLKIRHTGIVTADLQQSLHFYHDLLGFQVVIDSWENQKFIEQVLNLSNSVLHTIKLSAPDGQMIELLDFASNQQPVKFKPINEPGLTHFAIQVQNLDQLCETLKKQGILFNTEPIPSPDGKVKLAFCRAPEGTSIEIVEVL